MPSFPIPVFVACVLAFAAFRLWRRDGRISPLLLLLILCAAQSLIIALNQHYGIRGMRQVQPMIATLIPPAAWIAYQGRIMQIDILHFLGPLAAFFAFLMAPQFLDVILPGIFIIYGCLIIGKSKGGADTQPNTLFSSGDLPAQIWLVIGVALMASAISDILIVAAHITGYSVLRPWIISIFSMGNLLVIGLLSFSPHLHTEDDNISHQESIALEPDAEIWQKIKSYMAKHKPYLDPDLTLSRLSRKLGIPAKALSATINLATGGNVSRFINQARIEAAQRFMRDGQTVTNAMLSSGFNTKSNFNREFLRVVGKSPTAWLNDL